jgi:hypothetical protein
VPSTHIAPRVARSLAGQVLVIPSLRDAHHPFCALPQPPLAIEGAPRVRRPARSCCRRSTQTHPRLLLQSHMYEGVRHSFYVSVRLYWRSFSPSLSLSPSLSFSPLPWMHVAVGGQHVVAYPNPTTFSVNEVTLGVCTADPLFALAAEEAARVPPPPEDGTAAGPDRLSRLAEHIIQQQLCVHSVHSQTETQTHLQRDRHTRTGSAPTHARAHPWTQRAWLGHSAGQLTDCVMVGCAGLRYYPLHPPALGTAIDLTRMSALELPITPDILLLPSDLKPFVKARARTHRGIRLHAQRHEDMHVYTNTYTHARPNTYTHTRALACTHKATSTQGHTHDYRGRSRKTRPSLPLTGVQQKSGVRMLVMLLLCVYTCLPTIMPVDPC